MVKRIGEAISTIVVATVVMIAATLVFARAFGAGAYVVLSGSMEPTYSTGSLIYVKKVDPTELSADDIITYAVADDIVVTHRIIEVIRDEDQSNEIFFSTKGDANTECDAAPVSEHNVIGKAVVGVPYLGYAINYIKSPPGLYITIAVVALLIFFGLLPSKRTSNEARPYKEE